MYNLNMKANFDRVSLSIFGISTIFSAFILTFLPISFSIDSFAYISGSAAVRPHGYDFFINLFTGPQNSYIYFVILIQLFLTCLNPVIVYSTFKRFSPKLAFIAAVLILLNPYPYFMSVQIMSESLYIFIINLIFCFLVIIYQKFDIRLSLLITVLILIGSEIRPTTIFFILPLIYLTVINVRKNNVLTSIKRLMIPSILIVFTIVVKPMITENNGSANFPYFVWHYMIQCNNIDTSPKNGCLYKNNDDYTKEFYSLILKNLKINSDFYMKMAASYGVRGEILAARPEFSPPTEDKLIALANHLVYGRENNMHIGATLISELWRINGRNETSSLLNKVILNTVIQNPKSISNYFFWSIYKSVLFGNPYYFHDVTYWWFIPTQPEQSYLLNPYPLGSGTYASWVSNLDFKTGNNEENKIGSGNEIDPNSYGIKAIANSIESHNLTVIPLNLGNLALDTFAKLFLTTSPLIILFVLETQNLFLIPIILLMMLSVLFLFQKERFRFPLIMYFMSWSIIYIAIMSAVSTRHLVMHINLLTLAYVSFFIKKSLSNSFK